MQEWYRRAKLGLFLKICKKISGNVAKSLSQYCKTGCVKKDKFVKDINE